jgi:hypothetical protein
LEIRLAERLGKAFHGTFLEQVQAKALVRLTRDEDDRNFLAAN